MSAAAPAAPAAYGQAYPSAGAQGYAATGYAGAYGGGYTGYGQAAYGQTQGYGGYGQTERAVIGTEQVVTPVTQTVMVPQTTYQQRVIQVPQAQQIRVPRT
eukprot:389829-Rhodomonas_salina.3